MGPTNRVPVEEEEAQMGREAGHLGRTPERKNPQGLKADHQSIRRFPRSVHEEQTPFLFLSFFPLLELQGHMEVPRLGGQNGAMAAGLHHGSEQCRILNPLSGARDGTCILMDTSRIRFCCATMGTPNRPLFQMTTHTSQRLANCKPKVQDRCF